MIIVDGGCPLTLAISGGQSNLFYHPLQLHSIEEQKIKTFFGQENFRISMGEKMLRKRS
jgi:hypothetical protein